MASMVAVDNMMTVLRIIHQTDYKYSAKEVIAVLYGKG